MWEKIVDGCIAGIGVVALVEGWRRLRQQPPKPTDEDEFTRVDYLSGEYQRAFEEREQVRTRNEQQGKWCLVGGAAFLAGGVALLTHTIMEEVRSSADDEVTSPAKNGSSRKSPSRRSTESSVPEMTE